MTKLINGKMVVEKLYMLANEFQTHMRNREYSKAKHCYDTAVTVAVFMGLEENIKTQLFGERGERGEILRPGMFREEQVIKAYGECIKRGQERDRQGYVPIGSRKG